MPPLAFLKKKLKFFFLAFFMYKIQCSVIFLLQTILITVHFVVLPITLLHVNQNKMNTYFPLCREYNLCLPRREVEEVDNLRDEWIKLMELAERVSQ